MNEKEQRSIIRRLTVEDPRYREDAYYFVREGLDYTVTEQRSEDRSSGRHVKGWELAKGIRDYALKEYGPVSLRVLNHMGIRTCEDVGEIVYNMIGAELLGKTEDDEKSDFHGVYDFEEAFVRPFRPLADQTDPAEN